MNTLLLSGILFVGLTSVAVAQSAPATPPEPATQSASKSDIAALPHKGAHFRLEDGDAALDVKCPDDEPMKTCGEITIQILEKLVSLPKQPKS